MNKVAGLKPINFIKKRLWHICFPVNIANCLRKPLFKKICEQLLLTISLPSLWKSISDKCLYLLFFKEKHIKKVHLLRNSEQNVRTIIWLLLCYNIAIIRIIVELQQKLYICNETIIAIMTKCWFVQLRRCWRSSKL